MPAPAPTPANALVARARGRWWTAIAYAVALAIALGVGRACAGLHPLLVVGAADLAGTLAIFAFSVGFDNSSFYDPYWSLAPLPIAAYLAWLGHGHAPSLRGLLLAGPLALWSARLTWNFYRGWPGLHLEDWRYTAFRAATGRLYWLVSASAIHLFPTVLVYLGCLGLYPALAAGANPVGLLDLGALAVTAGAVALEAVADAELRRFRARAAPGAIMDQGVWAWSRHPNYLGEIGVWVGVALFGVAADPSLWWVWSGPLAMIALFVFGSVPMMDRRSLARRPEYGAVMKRIPALFPRPPRRR